MRIACLIVVALSGCNQLFEENPDFLETDSEVAADASGMDTAETTDDTAGDETGGLVCQGDDHEINNTENDAPGLTMISPADTMAITISAAMEGAGSVDWYRIPVVNPNGSALKVSLTMGSDLQVCQYVKCNNTGLTADVTCAMNEQAATTDNAYDGCCSTEVVQPSYTCEGVPGGEASAFIRVTDPMNRDECVPYSMQYQLIGG